MLTSIQLTEPADFFTRFIDRLPIGKLLIINDFKDLHAQYATELGWQVDQAHVTTTSNVLPTTHNSNYDAVFVLPMLVAETGREQTFKQIAHMLKPEGGNLFSILLQKGANLAPELGYEKTGILPLLEGYTVDAIQETELVVESEKLKGWEVSAVKNLSVDNRDSLSFSV